ncbi:TRAP transporter small permease subunit [Chamaesiphon sp. OTE_75_metabat_556]|uniref:TRAP transporter small permease subunit n=1 Tax=Chamaesiphon sp. OTE_75_metabat_556 TaxID=2964692 RepID=UPI0037C0C957
MRALLNFSRAIDKFTEIVGSSTSIIVLLTVAVGFYNVVARYVGRLIGIQLSSNALIELQWYLFSLMFFLGFAYILKHGANVRVDFYYANWTKKQQALLDFVGTVLFGIPFCLLGIAVTFHPVLQSWGLLPDGSWGSWEISPDADGLPRAPIKTMIIVAFVTLLLQSIAQAIKYLAVYKGYPHAVEIIEEDIENIPIE